MAKRGRDSYTESGLSPSRPALSLLGPTHHTPDHDPPARKAVRATSLDDADVPSTPRSPLPLGSACSRPARSAMHAASPPVGASVGASVAIAEYSVSPAPVVRPLPRFATQDITLTPDPAQLRSEANQLFPLSTGSGSSTSCNDMSVFDSDNSRLVVSDSPVSDVVSVVSLDMLSATSLCAPLSPQGSPVFTEVVDWGVVESPVSDAVVVPSDVSSVTCWFMPLNPQGSPLSPEVVDWGVME